ncbi:hypothetical protein E4P28_06020 [Rothia dentocariosa]|uniref:hypothetical protein n=1 Tax=Rothia dentocariosa TaxID=2047 RepID=UPI0010726D37|nr:hypothetical protein [Rothia dentocariosa]TFI35074.1 hypothetical protein E4P28_06020 [Rothia dentocariosa]
MKKTRIDRYHLREDFIYFDGRPNRSDIFLAPEWFEDFSKPVPVSFWEEVATRTLGFPYRRPGGYLKKIKFEEDLVIQKKVDSPEFTDLERLVFIPHPEQAVPPPELAGVFAQSFVLPSYTSQEVAEKFTHGHNSVIFLKIFEKVFSNTNGNGESVDLHGSNLWMNMDELRRGVHWYISRIEPQDGINLR